MKSHEEHIIILNHRIFLISLNLLLGTATIRAGGRSDAGLEGVYCAEEGGRSLRNRNITNRLVCAGVSEGYV